jgi:hypothetical protein
MGQVNEEVTLKDIAEGKVTEKPSFQKLHFCVKQAENDRLWFIWGDTCRIDKPSSVEIIEAINSMFR